MTIAPLQRYYSLRPTRRVIALFVQYSAVCQFPASLLTGACCCMWLHVAACCCMPCCTVQVRRGAGGDCGCGPVGGRGELLSDVDFLEKLNLQVHRYAVDG